MTGLAELLRALVSASGLEQLGHRRQEELWVTVGVVAAGILLHRLALGRARRFDDPDRGRALAVRSRNLLMAIGALVLLLAWGSELKSLAVSIAALAAAAVLALRDVIVCALGGFYRAVTASYDVGDTIEIGANPPLLGEVVDVDLLHTELVERTPGGHASTRRVRFPNVLLLTSPVRLHARSGDYSVRTLRVPVAPSVTDLARAEAALVSAASSTCAPFAAQAEHRLALRRQAELVDLPSHRLRVAIVPEKPDEVALVLRYPCPGGQQARVEREILLAYYTALAVPAGWREHSDPGPYPDATSMPVETAAGPVKVAGDRLVSKLDT